MITTNELLSGIFLQIESAMDVLMSSYFSLVWETVITQKQLATGVQ